jgi:hypothetical protein
MRTFTVGPSRFTMTRLKGRGNDVSTWMAVEAIVGEGCADSLGVR